MNIRKPVDYSELYAGIDHAMHQNLDQMGLYCEIGRLVSLRSEKGAAVAASEYLQAAHPEYGGFSPRNVRRMRDFYRLYENESKLLALALKLNWTQNVVILEADLEMDARKWYLRAAANYQWTKAELIQNIADMAHGSTEITAEEETVDCQGERVTSSKDCKLESRLQRLPAVRHWCQYLVMKLKTLYSLQPGLPRIQFNHLRIYHETDNPHYAHAYMCSAI